MNVVFKDSTALCRLYCKQNEEYSIVVPSYRDKSLLESWGTTFLPPLTASLNLSLIYFKITCALAILLEHMHKKFDDNQTRIKGGCQLGRKVVTQDSKSDWHQTSCACALIVWLVLM